MAFVQRHVWLVATLVGLLVMAWYVAVAAATTREDDKPVRFTAPRPETAVVERTCYAPNITDEPILVTVDGTLVELWCGTRVLVTGGLCEIQRGAALDPVECVRD